MGRRWIALLGCGLVAIAALGDVARGMAASDSGAELRRNLDDPAGAVLLASVPRALAAIEPPSRDGRAIFRHPARLGFVPDRRGRSEYALLAVSHGSSLPFRLLRYAPRSADASADPH